MSRPSHPSFVPVRAFPLLCALTLTLAAAAAGSAGAQTLGGQVVQLGSKKPLAGAAVALVNDSAQVVASSAAGPDGSFYLDAPAAGGYRLVVFVAGASFVAPTLQLDSSATVEREFEVPDVPESFAAALFARDVTSEARPLPGSPVPAYPAGFAEQGIRARVSTMYVVSESGEPDLATFRVLNDADQQFVESIRGALQHTRFVPAQKDEAAVRQVVQTTYDFGLAADPVRGDVVVRPPAPKGETREPPHAGPKTMYVITSDELAAPDVEQLTLADALHRLRPKLFGRSGGRTVTSPLEPPVFVNGVRVEGLASLRSITAGNVLEVRYWRREEAGTRFGMEYPYVVTVTMRPDRS